MIGIILKPMERGQITLPKEYREKLKINSSTLLNITLEEGRIVVKPMEKTLEKIPRGIIKPSVAKKDYLNKLKSFKGGLWTREDDSLLQKTKNKEKKNDW